MTNDELALIRAAAADPDEDTLRLAYADWLDEQDGEAFALQAAFVRLQVRRSRMDVFDPERADLLAQESAYLWKHKRDWNGRIHRHLIGRRLTRKVDARRGLIRSWDYHRGMITRMNISAVALPTYADLMFSLGPIEYLRLADWPHEGWSRSAGPTLRKLLRRLKVVSIVGAYLRYPMYLAALKPFAEVPILDLRRVNIAFRPTELLALVRAGALSPVVLFHWTVTVTPQQRVGRRYQAPESRTEVHVIDPHGKWDALRLWFADVTGEVLSPVPYQATSR
jgi:uncharacterized protein (TIGR02996 family)